MEYTMGIKKHIQINIVLLLLIVLFPFGFVWGEESPAQLLPTGRSLPDVIPSDGFVYVTPAGKTIPDSIDTPVSTPQPKLMPKEKTPTKAVPTPPEDGIEIPPDVGITPPTDTTPPATGIEIPPDGGITTPTDTTPPEDGIIIPPGGNVGILPDNSPSLSPNYNPDDDPNYDPDNDPNYNPEYDPGLYPNPAISAISPTDTPPPDSLDNPPGDYFVISPVNPQFPTEEETQPITEETTLVSGEEQQPKPSFDNIDIISNLNGGRYIQVASYTESDTASERVQKLQGMLTSTVADKVLVYKEFNSDYYRVVVGPFPLSEIGVNLYSIRRKGYTDAFTIQ